MVRRMESNIVVECFFTFRIARFALSRFITAPDIVFNIKRAENAIVGTRNNKIHFDGPGRTPTSIIEAALFSPRSLFRWKQKVSTREFSLCQIQVLSTVLCLHRVRFLQRSAVSSVRF